MRPAKSPAVPSPASGEGVAPTKFIGGFLSYDLVGKLSLFVLYRATSRARLIGELLEKALRSSPSQSIMVKEIAHRYVIRFQAIERSGELMTWATFRGKTEVALVKKKILPGDIDLILAEMDRLRTKKGKR